jgi:hypothetical protein
VLVVDDVPVLDGLLDRRVARMRAVLERRERVAVAREPQVLEAVVADLRTDRSRDRRGARRGGETRGGRGARTKRQSCSSVSHPSRTAKGLSPAIAFATVNLFSASS